MVPQPSLKVLGKAESMAYNFCTINREYHVFYTVGAHSMMFCWHFQFKIKVWSSLKTVIHFWGGVGVRAAETGLDQQVGELATWTPHLDLSSGSAKDIIVISMTAFFLFLRSRYLCIKTSWENYLHSEDDKSKLIILIILVGALSRYHFLPFKILMWKKNLRCKYIEI